MIGRKFISSVRDVILEAGHGATSYFRRLTSRARLAPVETSDQAIVEALETKGAYSTDLDALGASGSSELLQQADRLFDEIAQLRPKQGNKDYMVAAHPALITDYPEILRWGLNERFLAIAESYIGMPITYRGVLARLDMPDGTIRETRLWHLDQEDSENPENRGVHFRC